MGIFVPREKAEEISEGMVQLKKRDCLQPRQRALKPPRNMLAAYASAVSHKVGTRWLDFWGVATIFEDINRQGICPNKGLLVFIFHGTADKHVPVSSAQKLADILRKNFAELGVFLRLVLDKAHAFDYDASRYEYMDVYSRF